VSEVYILHAMVFCEHTIQYNGTSYVCYLMHVIVIFRSLLLNGYQGLFSLGHSGQGVKLTTHPLLYSRSRMVELYVHSPYIFMAWCLIFVLVSFIYVFLSMFFSCILKMFLLFCFYDVHSIRYGFICVTCIEYVIKSILDYCYFFVWLKCVLHKAHPVCPVILMDSL
jgi:hypothetical protein